MGEDEDICFENIEVCIEKLPHIYLPQSASNKKTKLDDFSNKIGNKITNSSKSCMCDNDTK